MKTDDIRIDILKISKTFLLTLCVLKGGIISAHNHAVYDYFNTPYSPLENEYILVGSDNERIVNGQRFANPIYFHPQAMDSLSDLSDKKAVVSLSYGGGRRKGDFLHYEGDQFSDMRVMGAGSHTYDGHGTLYGSVTYARGKDKDISWNACRHAELYFPYLSTDSVGGDTRYESYKVSGGYAFPLGRWTLGVHGAFDGEQAHRLTDPRLLTINTWLKAGVGVSCNLRGHLLSLTLAYARNKQHIALRYWRPGQQDRFFVCYGFGLYDKRESAVLFSYSRMYYINQFSTQLGYESPDSLPCRVSLFLRTEKERVDTEESDIQSLYYSIKTHWEPTLKVSWLGDHWGMSFLTQMSMNGRKGYENILDRYLSDVGNNIYDYRKISERQNYSLKEHQMLFRLEPSWCLTDRNRLLLNVGTFLHIREERYESESFEIYNMGWTPHFNLMYNYDGLKNRWSVSIGGGKRLNGKHRYAVTHLNQSMPHLDFQQAFDEYAYYCGEFLFSSLNFSYLCNIKKISLGFDIRCFMGRGERDKEVSYSQKIGFESSAPMIQREPDKHDFYWGQASLLVEF